MDYLSDDKLSWVALEKKKIFIKIIIYFNMLDYSSCFGAEAGGKGWVGGGDSPDPEIGR